MRNYDWRRRHGCALILARLLPAAPVRSPFRMNVITDPRFYPLAIIAVTALGLGKGGFAGVGVMATPLLATILPPLQGAAILLPILIVQDVISVWVYRRDWSAWHLKVMLPGGLLGIGIAWALATQVADAFVRLVIAYVLVLLISLELIRSGVTTLIRG